MPFASTVAELDSRVERCTEQLRGHRLALASTKFARVPSEVPMAHDNSSSWDLHFVRQGFDDLWAA